MRMYEYKIHVKVVEVKAQWLWTDMSTITDVGLAPWLFNLYIDQNEEYPVDRPPPERLAGIDGGGIEGPRREQEITAEEHRAGSIATF
jgi:hypothetical protein